MPNLLSLTLLEEGESVKYIWNNFYEGINNRARSYEARQK
jgi:hypothetical protein